jgi:hypothetical protein
MSFESLPHGREGWNKIAADLEQAVRALSPR